MSAQKLERFNIEKLRGLDNWLVWKFDINLQLTMHKLQDIVKGVETLPVPPRKEAPADEIASYKSKLTQYEDRDALLQCIVGCSVSTEPKRHILTARSGKEMWDILHSVYEQKNDRRLDLLYCQLFTYTKDETDDIATHVSKLQALWQQLNDELKEEGSLPQSLLMNRILNTLPSTYLEFKNAWESVPKENRSISTLMERLRLHEQRLEDLGTNPSPSSSTSDNALLLNKKKVKCSHCNKIGHTNKQCFVLKKLKKRNKSNETVQDDGDAFLSRLDDSNSNFIVDSGASHHVTSSANWFRSYSPFDKPRALRLGDDRAMYAYGQGIIDVEMSVQGKWKRAHLNNVWYVPQAGQNLFSAGSALDHGYIEIADKDKRVFKDKSGQVKAVSIRDGNLYRLLMRVITDNACVVKEGTSLQIWHERLCHQNKRHVKDILTRNGIKFSPDQSDCDGCVYGKMTRLSFGTRQHRGTKPGDQINADVCGPMSELSLGGRRYFVVFKDDYTRFRKVYFLKQKSEVASVLPKFLAEIKTAGHVVKELLTDGGKEFNNAEVHRMTEAVGLYHRLSMPYTPEQNGAAERENRILVEAARSMLYNKDLPKKLWAEAINTASYVLNRTGPTQIEGKTPYELWYNKQPHIDHLRIFGTECFVHIPSQKRKKLDKKAIKGYLVGYCGDKDGYRIWIPEKNDVIISRDVLFRSETVSSDFCKLPYISGEREDHETTEVIITDNDSSLKENQDEAGPSNTAEDQIPPDLDEAASHHYNLRDRQLLQSSRSNCCICLSEDEPQTYKQAMKSENHEEWSTAMEEELNSLKENNTWILVNLPENREALSNKWVYKIKKKVDGSIERFKARLVIRGFSQEHGIDYHETFSPVVRWDTIRAMLSEAAIRKMHMTQFDVKTAFLYGDIDEVIYMKQPVGYDDGSGRVCKLIKSLYGLKQAPRCWNKKFCSFLLKYKLKQSDSDPCLFISQDRQLIIMIYVDDGLILSPNKTLVEEFLSALTTEFQVRTSEVGCYLGLQINQQNDGSIFINQEAYIKTILKSYDMCDANSVLTPIDKSQLTDNSNFDTDTNVNNFHYRELVGKLLYLSIVSRPDICFAINVLSKHVEKPDKRHYAIAKRVLRYLKGTQSLGILYKGLSGEENTFVAYSDADYAGDIETRRSTSGYACLAAGGAVSWSSKTQRCVSLSTTESEFVAASLAAQTVIWLSRLYREVRGYDVIPTVYVDNQSAIKLVKNPVFHFKTKHIDTRYKFLQELHQEKKVNVLYVPSQDQVADTFTKALPKESFLRTRTSLGLVSKPDLI